MLTLEQAMAAALKNSRNVKIASLGMDASRQQFLVAKSKRFPAMSTHLFGGESLTPIGLTIKKGQFDSYPATGPMK